MNVDNDKSMREAAGLVSRVSWPRRSPLPHACTPLTKSKEKLRLLVVYISMSFSL